MPQRVAEIAADRFGQEVDVLDEPGTVKASGVPELLDELTRRQLPFTVLSNKPDEATRSVVGKLLGKWRFAVVRGALPGVAKKPDPAAALGIARELGIAPASFLYLGDTGTDMRTATAAGMYPVGALWNQF